MRGLGSALLPRRSDRLRQVPAANPLEVALWPFGSRAYRLGFGAMRNSLTTPLTRPKEALRPSLSGQEALTADLGPRQPASQVPKRPIAFAVLRRSLLRHRLGCRSRLPLSRVVDQASKANFFRERRPRSSIFGSHHWVVFRETPFLAVLFRGHS